LDETTLLAELEEVCAKLEVKVRYEDYRGFGGYCVMRGQRMIIVPRALDAGDRGGLLARELSRLDHADVYMAPRVREAIRAGAVELERMQRSLKPNAMARRRGAATDGRPPTVPPGESEAEGASPLLDAEPHGRWSARFGPCARGGWWSWSTTSGARTKETW